MPLQCMLLRENITVFDFLLHSVYYYVFLSFFPYDEKFLQHKFLQIFTFQIALQTVALFLMY